MTERLLVGLDVGTSAVKAVAFTPSGTVVATGRAELTVRRPAPGWAEVDPEAWWSAVCAATRECLGGAGGGEPAAVGLSTVYPTLVPLGAEGRPVRPALLYSDQRAAGTVEGLRADGALAEMERLTGNRCVPGTTSLTGALWMREHEAERFRETACFGHPTTYLLARLCGVRAMDATSASLSGGVRSGSETVWDPSLLRCWGMESADCLPEVATGPSRLGTVSAAAATATGLPEGLPVCAGCGDAPAALLGGGVRDDGTVLLATGSSDCAMRVRSAPCRDLMLANCRHGDPERWVSVASMTSAGAAVAWFGRTVLGAGASAAAVSELAGEAPAGSGGVVFLPYLQGERTPHWDARARGLFLGLHGSTGRCELARAVLEGVAFANADLVESLRPEDEGGRLLVSGGGARSGLWNRIRASVLGREVEVMEVAEASALGAAILAGVAGGVYADVEDGLRATAAARSTRRVEPDRAWSRLYAERRPLFARLYGRLRDEMHELAGGGG